MICEKLFQKIDQLNESYINVWETCCNLESPTRDKARVDAVGRYFAELAEKKGWKVEIVPQEKAGDLVVITLNPDAPGAPISLSGHLDTVHPVGSFGTPAVRIEGDKIYGPGVLDCKGGVVAGFMAMDALEQVGFTARPVRLLLQTDEEVGSNLSGGATLRYICEKAKDSECFLNLEGHTEHFGCVARKGIAPFRFIVTGVEGHASKCAELGSNAIAEAAHIVLRLEQLKDGKGITCNCGVIQGGTVTNTIPKNCELAVDFRFANKEQLAQIQAMVQDIADHPQVPGCTIQVESIGVRPAMEYVQRNVNLLGKMNEIYAANGLPVLGEGWRTGGSDAAYVTDAGIPCVDSIGATGNYIHTPREFAWLYSLAASAKRIAAVVYCL